MQLWPSGILVRLGVLLLLLASPVAAQHDGGEHQPVAPSETSPHDHGHPSQPVSAWEGSPEGKAYSEFNHHLAGIFVLLIGLSELRLAMGLTALAWSRFLLPVAMFGAGSYLMIWSDHEAWPIGSLSLSQTFFGGDWEMLQHKLYGILLLTVGTLEWFRRKGRIRHSFWVVPLPAFAIIGGLFLFLHSHGAHPSAHKIAVHHTIMGVMALAAGSAKFVSGWRAPASSLQPGGVSSSAAGRSYWELGWAGFILLIGIQLLIYTE
ncbi:MAG: hypothetical protein ACREIS_09480 [Nitrospiraceae bacterium]